MIDIKLIRNNKEIVKQSEINRFRKPELVDIIYDLDQKWVKTRQSLDNINRKMNMLQEAIKDIHLKLYSSSTPSDIEKDDDAYINDHLLESIERLMIKEDNDIFKQHSKNMQKPELLACRNVLKIERADLTNELDFLEKEINIKLNQIGNILHENVKISKDENDNPVIRKYETEAVVYENRIPYAQILNLVDGCDTLRGSLIAGHRGYFLFEDLALLGMALSKYAIDFMRERGFRLCQVPQFLTGDVMSKTAQLNDFDEQLYSIGDSYLIATSEQPLTALYMNENLFNLPIKLVGQSICYRKEAGAHGKDNQGIFRVHQFEKIEQFVICDNKDSESMFKEMVDNVEMFYQSLKIPYRIVSIVSGALNDAAAIKYDLEGWFPTRNEYRELVSCSNCTDYQSRSLNVKYGFGNDSRFVHMLNCTVVAVQRMLCCLIENYQVEDGIVVPDVLREYMKTEKIFYKKNEKLFPLK